MRAIQLVWYGLFVVLFYAFLAFVALHASHVGATASYETALRLGVLFTGANLVLVGGSYLYRHRTMVRQIVNKLPA